MDSILALSRPPQKLTARPSDLNAYFAPVTSLKGVGEKVGDSLTRAMGARLKDLVLTPPTGLIDRTNRPTIACWVAAAHFWEMRGV